MSQEGIGVEGRVVMPFYVLCDVSGSMITNMGELNACLHQLRADLIANPVVGDVVMLSVIAFNHEAHTVVRLTEPTRIHLPRLSAGGGTDYGKAFREYHRAFEIDRARLKSEGARVYRPCIFFLSDGEPSDPDYLHTFQSLLGYNPATREGNPAYPYVIAFGFRDVQQQTIESLAYPNFGERDRRGRWFIAHQNTASDALKSFTTVIGHTVLASAQTAGSGVPMLVPPASAANMHSGVAGFA